ncbi:hypothetical protein [Silvibacterium sp.]|uniref:hypothetical protein n=1 Tax=Silvibacterium sp. TaxID=1964179 RepID=UPI0039E41EE5
MQQRPLLAALIGLCFVAFSGCTSRSHDQDSQIVRTVEAAGAGSLSGLDQGSIEAWLNSHETTAKQIAAPCKIAGQRAPANWLHTTEGAVCAADARVMFTMPTNLYKPY